MPSMLLVNGRQILEADAHAPVCEGKHLHEKRSPCLFSSSFFTTPFFALSLLFLYLFTENIHECAIQKCSTMKKIWPSSATTHTRKKICFKNYEIYFHPLLDFIIDEDYCTNLVGALWTKYCYFTRLQQGLKQFVISQLCLEMFFK